MEINIGDFVYHSDYGVGRIQEITTPEPASAPETRAVFDVKIKFQSEDIKPFTSELLERSIRKISPHGFRAYAYLDEPGAKELLTSDPVEAIALILQDFPGMVARTEDLKDYLSKYISQWDEWWETVQPKLKESQRIDTTRSRLREYGLRHDFLSPAEEAYQAFHRIRPFEDKSIVYDQARRTLTELRNGSALTDEHLQDVVDYVRQIIELSSNKPNLRLDAIFRLQEGKWLSTEQVSDYLAQLIKPDLKLYQLEAYALNRLIEFLINQPLTTEVAALLASGMCASEAAIKTVCEWALKRADTSLIAGFLGTALSENIPPQLEVDKLGTFSTRLGYAEKMINGIEIDNKAWGMIVSNYKLMLMGISRLDTKNILPLYDALNSFSKTLYERVRTGYPDLSGKIMDSLLNRDNPLQFVLGLVDSANKSKVPASFGSLLEEYLWTAGENRNYDFLKEIIQTKGSTLEQVKALIELIGRYESTVLKSRVGEVVCELIKKDTTTDTIHFLPYLNKLHEFEGDWGWSKTVEGLRESMYLEALGRSTQTINDRALISAVNQFIGIRMSALTTEMNEVEKEIQRANLRINELEGLLEEKEQVVRELRGGYGGDAIEARFNEKVRIVKELASSVAEFERMELKTTEKSRDIQAIMLRLNSILAGLKVLPMETIGSQIQFNPQKHQAVDMSIVEPGEVVVVVERGYLLRDNNEKLRLLKPALVKK